MADIGSLLLDGVSSPGALLAGGLVYQQTRNVQLSVMTAAVGSVAKLGSSALLGATPLNGLVKPLATAALVFSMSSPQNAQLALGAAALQSDLLPMAAKAVGLPLPAPLL